MIQQTEQTADTGRTAEEAADQHEAAEPGEALTTLEVLRQLQAGEIRAEDLPVETRRRCVEHLTLVGFSAADIAGAMHVSERTVCRDREATRRAGAVEPTLTLGDELIGEYQRWTLASLQRLARLAHDNSAPAYARLWAEEAVSRVYQRFVATADKLGFVEHGNRRRAHLRELNPQTGQPLLDTETLLQVLGEMGGRGLDGEAEGNPATEPPLAARAKARG